MVAKWSSTPLISSNDCEIIEADVNRQMDWVVLEHEMLANALHPANV